MTFVAAATIPIAFLTAHYGLHHLAKVSSGEKVLIHSAAGGVGMAAVQIAQNIGAQIFGAASEGKWSMLKELGVPNVLNSRSLDFAQDIERIAGKNSIDIVLNSLSSEFISESLKLLAEGGRFLEIGKAGICSQAEMAQIRQDVAYSPHDLAEICRDNPDLIRTLFHEIMSAFETGELQPLPHTVFSIENVEDAFRYMGKAKHRGKVVISHEQTPVVRKQATYLITGGLGALGLQVAH